MADQPKPKTFEELQAENFLKEDEKNKRMEKVRLDTIERLKTDPAIQKYFGQFNQHSIDGFISSYANVKKLYMEYGEQFASYAQTTDISYVEDAEHCLELIQLKKLFDLRCQWGANQIQIPGIETSWDFLRWSIDIFNAPFLSPIGEDEFELFLRFSKTSDFAPIDFNDWLGIERQRSGNTDEELTLPEWFYYHNTHTNASGYFALPDLRGEKEKFYRILWSKEQKAETERKYESGEIKRHVPDNRPMLYGHYFEEAEDFVKRFEDDDARKKFYGYTSYSDHLGRRDDGENDYLNEQAEELIQKIVSLKVPVAVEANSDIRLAIIEAWEKYKYSQVAASLPAAYQEYLFRTQNNIAFAADTPNAEHYKQLAESVKQQILRGREMNGEPRDLNF
jgi:hypothetical protein